MNLFTFLTLNNPNNLLKKLINSYFKYTHLWVNGEKISDPFSKIELRDCNNTLCLQTNSEIINYLNNTFSKRTPLVLYGELRYDLNKLSLNEISTKLRVYLEHYINREDYLRELLYEFFTKFIIVALIDDDIKIISDHIGYYPLFYYSTEDLKIFSNIKRNMWLVNAQPLKELEFYPKPVISPIISELLINEKNVIDKLEKMLTEAVLKQVPGNSNIGVMFSGGLDSLIITKLLIKLNKSFNNKITLITAGLGHSKDILHVRSLKQLINLPVTEVLFTVEDCSRILHEIILTIERYDTLNVSLAIPEYFALKKASESGIKIVFSGQGADELFYGYHKYAEALKKGLSVREISDQDILSLSVRNMEREMKLAFKFNLELKYPYLDPKLISYVRGLPDNYKLKQVNGVFTSKYILRLLGEKIGVPVKALIGKVAMQYGSGAMKVLRRISYHALKNSTAKYKITEFLKKTYLETLKEKGYI